MKKLIFIVAFGLLSTLSAVAPTKCYHMWSSIEGAKSLEKVYTLPALKMIYGVENFTGVPATLENGKKVLN